MAYDIHAKGHHSITDFTEVHSRLESTIRMRYEATSENAKAAEMEKYLRAIKMVTSNVNQTNQNSLASTLDDLAYDDLIELAQESLNIMNANGRSVSSIKQLFNREHKAFIKKGAAGDDIFEEELYSILKAANSIASFKISTPDRSSVYLEAYNSKAPLLVPISKTLSFLLTSIKLPKR